MTAYLMHTKFFALRCVLLSRFTLTWLASLRLTLSVFICLTLPTSGGAQTLFHIGHLNSLVYCK